MADQKAEKATATKAEPEVEEAPKVERERLIANASDFFGVEPYVAAGALSEYDHRKADLTIDEGQKAIDSFLKRPVKEG